jgi:3-dehydroquinate synthase
MGNVISRLKPSSVFILVDSNTKKFCLPVFLHANFNLSSSNVIEIEAGEKQKTFSSCEKIINHLIENNADRKSLILNVGGGVICDIGAFVASVYKRGITFINVPTTLLSMVDASIGGKNGINFSGIKNLIGTFRNPHAVIIHPDFLDTLSDREKRSGYAEIIKHGLISKLDFLFADSFPISSNQITEVINDSINFKLKITSADFYDTDKRAMLNFGHTIGHALESFSLTQNNPLLHGEAVAAGMIAELFLSCKLAGFPEQEMSSSIQLIRNTFSELKINATTEDLFPFLFSDKKNQSDQIGFSLLHSIGNPAGLFFPEKELIHESINFMIDEFTFTALK